MLLGAVAVSPVHVGAQESEDAFDEAVEVDRRPVQVYVENGNWLDVEVYAVRGVSRIRLGTVRSQEGRFFELPVHAVGAGQQVRLLADPIGSRQALSSGVVMINPGDIVEWRLRNALNQSSLSVWST